MSEDDIVAVKGGVSPAGASVELRVGGAAPGALARLFPRMAAKRQVTAAITSHIMAKIEARERLDGADLAFAKEVFGDAETKWLRRQQIVARAERVLEAKVPLALPPQSSAEPSAESTTSTSEDWVNHFWDDAGLVSDSMLQELYGRLLAGEATHPGTCSMRTLRTIRYLDRVTAEQFAKVAPLVVNQMWVPRDDALMKKYNVSWDMLLDLDDAGLLESGDHLHTTHAVETVYYRWDTKLIEIKNAKALNVPVFPLRVPGKELSRVADIARTPEIFLDLAQWIRNQSTTIEVAWADVPPGSGTWSRDELKWVPVTTG